MKKVTVKELVSGMILGRPILNKNMVVILSAGKMLTDKNIYDLQSLDDISSIYIKDESDLNKNYQAVREILNKENAFVKKYTDIMSEASDLFQKISKNKNFSLELSGKKLEHSLVPIIQESGIIDYLYALSNMSNDVYHHSVRVAILAGVIGKWLHLAPAEIDDLILAGFLHDIGKTRFTKKMANINPASLTQEEYKTYIMHPIYGKEILSGKKGVSDEVIAAAMQHHESLNGTGYPLGLKDKVIHKYARIIAVADHYDNITQEREGEIKRTPFDAMQIIAKNMYSTLDAKICVPFIMNIQNTFIASKVGLSDGRKGKIIYYPNDYASLPIVRIEDGTEDNQIADLNVERTLHNVRIVSYNAE